MEWRHTLCHGDGALHFKKNVKHFEEEEKMEIERNFLGSSLNLALNSLVLKCRFLRSMENVCRK